MPTNSHDISARAASPALAERDGRLVISIPMQLKRRSFRKEIVVPQGLPGAVDASRSPSPLALAVARAHRWASLLEDGRYPTIRALADALELDRSYVARILNLTLVAPDATEAILGGNEPSGMSIEGIRKDLPMRWEDQRVQFGQSRSTIDKCT
jgi:hypothetical protein